MIRPEDLPHLERALDLAERGGRLTAPNPRVGAVVVVRDEVIGEGWHRRAGESHAEVLALEAAGEAARGATLYCSLEPCAHHGRTPPCVDAIIGAGIARVVVGVIDPDPRVSGSGLARLAGAGVAVELAQGDIARRAERAIEEYLLHRREGRAFAALKVAASLDGRIADRNARSRWITGQQARAHGRRLRDRYGAILVGAGTVRADDPLLLPPGGAGEGAPPFLRCVVDGGLEISHECRLLRERVAGAAVIVYCRDDAPDVSEEALRRAGAEVVRVPAVDGLIEPAAMLRDLGARGVLGVVIEGGGATHGTFLAAGLVDKLYWYVAPIVLGDPGAVASVSIGQRNLEEAYRLRIADVTSLEDDLVLTLYPS